MKYLTFNPERERAVSELIKLRHGEGNLAALSISKALYVLRHGGTAHRALMAADNFLRRVS